MSCISYAQISVSHDDMFYLAVNEDEVAVTVTNNSDQLVVVKNTLHDNISSLENNDGEKIKFDLDNESLAVDVYPRIVPIPPSQSRILTVKLAEPIDDSKRQEAAYRIRSTPLSSKDILTQQPLLYRLLAKKDRENIEEMANTEGEMEVTIGVGSIIIFQKEWQSDRVAADINITPDNQVIIKNSSDKVIRLRQVKFYDVDSSKWLYHDSIIIRPNHDQLIAAYAGKNISKMDFVDHLGMEHSIKANQL